MGEMSESLEGWFWRSEPLAPGSAVVFDIDGVLANADGRQHFITSPSRDWHSFFHACDTDKVITETQRLLDIIDPGIVVVLLTGRPIEVSDKTLEWLNTNDLRWDLLIMRKRGDYNASLSFKQQTIRQLRVMGFAVALAFEDDQRNREMFQNEGIPCMYVHSGYYESRDSRDRRTQ